MENNRYMLDVRRSQSLFQFSEVASEGRCLFFSTFFSLISCNVLFLYLWDAVFCGLH